MLSNVGITFLVYFESSHTLYNLDSICYGTSIIADKLTCYSRKHWIYCENISITTKFISHDLTVNLPVNFVLYFINFWLIVAGLALRR